MLRDDSRLADKWAVEMMLFGSPEQFAVEAMLEPGPEYGFIQGRNLAGRIRIWAAGQAIGRFDEPACWLGPPCQHLVEMEKALDTLWDASFDGLGLDDIFDRLDYEYFGAHRHRCIEEGWSSEVMARFDPEPTQVGANRFVFLIHSSEAFDGWKPFLVRPSEGNLVALVLEYDRPDIVALHFPTEACRQAVRAFARWFDEEERRYLPELFQ
jgi:hypothetical protein